MRLGNLGHTNSVGEGVQELKIDFGPGYRIYFGQDGDEVVILLCGGDKSSQADDIAKAKGALAKLSGGKGSCRRLITKNTCWRT